jgi:hypothetical protein
MDGWRLQRIQMNVGTALPSSLRIPGPYALKTRACVHPQAVSALIRHGERLGERRPRRTRFSGRRADVAPIGLWLRMQLGSPYTCDVDARKKSAPVMSGELESPRPSAPTSSVWMPFRRYAGRCREAGGRPIPQNAPRKGIADVGGKPKPVRCFQVCDIGRIACEKRVDTRHAHPSARRRRHRCAPR